MLVEGDIYALTFEPESFDRAVSFYTLFHLPRSKLEAILCGRCCERKIL